MDEIVQTVVGRSKGYFELKEGSLYPALHRLERQKQLNSFWRQEIVVDFFFELSVYGTYDSQPPEGALQTSDYGLVTSIGYSFWP